MANDSMKIAIVGAGAVGSYYGARLAKAGVPVILLARGATFQQLKDHDVIVKSYTGDFSARVPVTDSIKGLKRPATIILAVKCYDTDSVIEQIWPAVSKGTLLLSLQNGVENETKLARAFGAEKVAGAVCYIGAEVTAPGVVVHSARGSVAFGEMDGRPTDRIQKIYNAFAKAGIPSTLSQNILGDLWTKLAWNSAFNQVCAVARVTVGQALDSPEHTSQMKEVMAEVMAVAKASGVKLDPQMIEKSLELSRNELRAVRPSMLQDLEKGRRLEHDAFGGFIMREGKRLGIPVPANNGLYLRLS